MCAIHLGPAQKREVQLGRNFVRSLGAKKEFDAFWAVSKKKEIDALSSRLTKRTNAFIGANTHLFLNEFANLSFEIISLERKFPSLSNREIM